MNILRERCAKKNWDNHNPRNPFKSSSEDLNIRRTEKRGNQKKKE